LVMTHFFFSFSFNSCPFLASHLTLAIPIIAAVLFFFVISCLLQTSFRDPGILPRATPSEAADLEKRIDSMGTSTYRPPARTMEVVINKYVVKLKYCYTCKMFRPPRTSHCSVCDNCVGKPAERKGAAVSCVAGRAQLWGFLAARLSLGGGRSSVLLSSGCRSAAVLPVKARRGRTSAVRQAFHLSSKGLNRVHYRVINYLLSYLNPRLPLPFQIKGSWSNKRGSEFANPYSHKSILTNCCAVLCGPFHPSLIDRRGFIQPDGGTPSSPKSEIPSFGAKTDTSM
ncbi:ZDH18 Palmitoyltransferase, partial [Uria aalge]|nr:ZDH18 Palmitoyltransferase [Uria aalge]